MSDPIERLRAVLAALDGPLTLNGRDGVILDRHARCVARAPLLSQSARGGRAEADAIAALGTLWPALLAVVEAAAEVADHRRRCSTGDVEPYEGDRVHSRLVARLDALDAAIAVALPEEP